MNSALVSDSVGMGLLAYEEYRCTGKPGRTRTEYWEKLDQSERW